ncbi:MAG: adenine phosphoribosyltransferase [Planctomycetes bacterium]|nr:adenine phosphoribosyltransferase [Planctomycetota bacterium]
MTDTIAERLRRHVQEIQDFPKAGLRFRDITPILRDPILFREAIDALAAKFAAREIDLIVGIESRGYILAAPLAYRLSKGFLPIQREDRLPEDTGTAYGLGYGFNPIDVHEDALTGGRKVLLVDDLLATGATMATCVDLVREAGGEPVAAAVLVEIPALEGRKRLGALELISLCQL